LNLTKNLTQMQGFI